MTDVGFEPMTDEHIDWWEVAMESVIRSDRARADWDWKWSSIGGPHLNGGFLYTDGTRSKALTMGIYHDDVFVPCGMLLVLIKPQHLPNRRRKAVYLWYFSDAPRDALVAQGLPLTRIPKSIARVLLDTAICESLDAQCSGRLGLHASPNARDVQARIDLYEWYQGRHMKPLRKDKMPPPLLLHLDEPANDGRYFYYESDTASRAQSELISWR